MHLCSPDLYVSALHLLIAGIVNALLLIWGSNTLGRTHYYHEGCSHVHFEDTGRLHIIIPGVKAGMI